MCGLKHVHLLHKIDGTKVTPCVGVWIETPYPIVYVSLVGVTPCVGVWIETSSLHSHGRFFRSHPAWVCGLKHYWGTSLSHRSSHTLRGCVDWNWSYYYLWLRCRGHTLRGCVDWNCRDMIKHKKLNVTPCVGVWIETDWFTRTVPVNTSHPAWVCGLKPQPAFDQLGMQRHTLRGCVDWNSGQN